MLLQNKTIPLRVSLSNGLMAIFAMSFMMTSCAQTEVPANGWESALYADHSLVGKIWDSNSQAFITENELFAAISSSKYALLGEKHDNPDHHALQLSLLNQLLNANRLDSVSLEMIDSSSDTQLETVLQQSFGSLDDLKEYLGWDEEGWDWSYYGPLIMESLQAGIAVRSANISNQQMGEIYGQALDPSIASVLSGEAIEQLNEEIDASHCNMLPASQFPAMVGIQQTRDHQMALSLTSEMVEISPGKVRLLIAGNYHVRQDLSVPNYLLALDSSTERDDIVALGILEVSPESDDPVDYMQAYSDVAPYDYVWFTPAISNEDYCASLQQ